MPTTEKDTDLELKAEIRELKRKLLRHELACAQLRKIHEPLACNRKLMQVANAARQTLNILKEL